MASASQTFERKDVTDATLMLIQDNAEHLISYIYKNKDKAPYNDPVVRVGLTLKTLLKVDANRCLIDGDVLEPAINELTQLRNNAKGTAQYSVYDTELRYLSCCVVHSDLVTLNTMRC
jgi:hypothetical protein